MNRSSSEKLRFESEALDVVHYPVRELVAMVMSGEIEDGKSQAAILMAARELGI